MGYIAQIVAEEGLLIGGVKQHNTAAFEDKRDAYQLAAEFYRTNKAAGRRPSKHIKVYAVARVDIYVRDLEEDG